MFNRTLWTHSRHPPGPSSPPRSPSTNINTTLISALSRQIGGDKILAKRTSQRTNTQYHSLTNLAYRLWCCGPNEKIDDVLINLDEVFLKLLFCFRCFQFLASRLLGTFRPQSPQRPASGSPGTRHPAMWRDTRWPFTPPEMMLTWGSYWSVPTIALWSWRNSGEHPGTEVIGRSAAEPGPVASGSPGTWPGPEATGRSRKHFLD